jgi:hypothetical protein
MYKVIEMHGDNEPWWFFDNWEDDITASREFDKIEEALCFYKDCWRKMSVAYPEVNSKKNFLSAFWTEEDVRWCEECDNDLQQYHGLALLENGKAISEELGLAIYEIMTKESKFKGCMMKLKAAK